MSESSKHDEMHAKAEEAEQLLIKLNDFVIKLSERVIKIEETLSSTQKQVVKVLDEMKKVMAEVSDGGGEEGGGEPVYKPQPPDPKDVSYS